MRAIFALSLATATLTAQAPGKDPPPGTLVSVGAHKLHLRCVGDTTAKPVVFFEAGGGGYSGNWFKVQELLPRTVRSCGYDRAGLGWSERGPGPRTMRQEVLELHELLDAIKAPAPIVIVGHSIGALNARAFAHTYPIEVAGMVMVDPTHESQTVYSTTLNRWVRLRETSKRRPVPEPVKIGPVASATYDPAQDFLAEEFERLFLARRQTPQPLGDKPLIVIGAGNRERPPGLPDSAWAQLRFERDAQVKDLAKLSRNSRFVLDPKSGHGIPTENPEIVAKAIVDLLDALSRGNSLTP
jgi:pimeloyl-ACP methyl ester carboxylesterase